MQWGAHPIGGGLAEFNLWAPDQTRVALELRNGGTMDMTPAGNGWFSAETAAEPGTRYRFRLGDNLAVPDPASRRQDGGVHGWSVLVDHTSYAWRNRAWLGRPIAEMVICEVHAGLFGGFSGLAGQLRDFVETGVTAIELMPVGAFRGNRNWGYDGVLPYAPAEAYGTPDDLKALVDAAHDHGLMIYLDVVYNHFGPEGNYLGQYAKDFFVAGAPNFWGESVAVRRPPVARFFIDNALMWLNDYRFDGLRFDAVHAIGDSLFLDALGAEIREKTGGRHVHLVLENEGNDADRLPYPFDAQWNDDFHNVMHVLLTGETDGYYGDFADGPAEKLARCLKEGFIYQGEVSGNLKGKPRGKPSGHLPPLAFVNFLQNHDQTGNRAYGERLTVLTGTEKLRAATALLLLSPFVPLIFMGDAVGSETPFFFFTDFEGQLAEVVREGRRREFARFPAFSDPEARTLIPDPGAPETFERSHPRPGPQRAMWAALYETLLAIRRQTLAPRLEGTRSLDAGAAGERAVHAAWQLGDGTRLTIVFNAGDEPCSWRNAPGSEPLFETGDFATGPGCAVWLEDRP